MHSLARIVRSASALWPFYLGVFLTSVITAGLTLVSPFLLKEATDTIVEALGSADGAAGTAGSVTRTVLWLAVGLFAADLARTLAGNLGGYIGDVMAARMRQVLSTRYFAKLLSLPQAFFDTQRTGTIIARLDRSIASITQFLQSFANNFFSHPDHRRCGANRHGDLLLAARGVARPALPHLHVADRTDQPPLAAHRGAQEPPGRRRRRPICRGRRPGEGDQILRRRGPRAQFLCQPVWPHGAAHPRTVGVLAPHGHPARRGDEPHLHGHLHGALRAHPGRALHPRRNGDAPAAGQHGQAAGVHDELDRRRRPASHRRLPRLLLCHGTGGRADREPRAHRRGRSFHGAHPRHHRSPGAAPAARRTRRGIRSGVVFLRGRRPGAQGGQL